MGRESYLSARSMNIDKVSGLYGGNAGISLNPARRYSLSAPTLTLPVSSRASEAQYDLGSPRLCMAT